MKYINKEKRRERKDWGKEQRAVSRQRKRSERKSDSVQGSASKGDGVPRQL